MHRMFQVSVMVFGLFIFSSFGRAVPTSAFPQPAVQAHNSAACAACIRTHIDIAACAKVCGQEM